MSFCTRLLLPTLVVFTPLLAGPPPANIAINQARQFQTQMQFQMQMQMGAARLAAQQAQRRRANEQAARLKNASGLEEIAKPLGEAWRISLPPEGNRAEDTTTVVVVGEKRLIARSRDKAAEIWSAALEGGFESGPVVSNGLVLYTTPDYRCVALDKDSGKPRYQVQLEALRKFFSADNNKTKVQFPIIEGKRVYLATYGKGTDGEAAGKLYALDLDTGAKIWDAPLAAGADHPPVILGDRVLVGGAPWIQAFQVADGKPLWKTNLGSSKWISFGMVAQGQYCLTADRNVMALDLAKGEVVWKAEVGQSLTGDDQRLFSIRVGQWFGGATLVALDPATGKTAWERKGVGTLPWIQEGRAYFVEDTTLRCLDVADGKQVWELPMSEPAPWPPMIIGSQLFVACPRGKTTALRSLDPATGRESWSFTVQGKPGSGMFVADAAGILFPGKDGEVIGLK